MGCRNVRENICGLQKIELMEEEKCQARVKERSSGIWGSYVLRIHRRVGATSSVQWEFNMPCTYRVHGNALAVALMASVAIKMLADYLVY